MCLFIYIIKHRQHKEEEVREENKINIEKKKERRSKEVEIPDGVGVGGGVRNGGWGFFLFIILNGLQNGVNGNIYKFLLIRMSKRCCVVGSRWGMGWW